MADDRVPEYAYLPWSGAPMGCLRFMLYPVAAFAAIVAALTFPPRAPFRDWLYFALMGASVAALTIGLELMAICEKRELRRIYLEGTPCRAKIARKRTAHGGGRIFYVEYELGTTRGEAVLHVPSKLYSHCAVGDTITVRALSAYPNACVLAPDSLHLAGVGHRSAAGSAGPHRAGPST